MATNMTSATDLPPLPSYSVVVAPDLLPWLPDFYLSIIAPTAAYWAISIFFHIIDVYDLFPQYRLHTPAEIAQRNKATRYEVFRDVIFQQIIQAVMSFVLGMTDPPQYTGMEEYDVAVWATRVRLAQRALPTLLGVLGVNAATVSKNMALSHPLLAGALAGGHYPFLTTELAGPDGIVVPAFATWELLVAKFIYYLLIPGFQLFAAVTVLDTWQYFLHRLMHQNKWLYATFHSRHHRLYVPYAYGALYNHPFEGFLLDTAGAGLAYKVACMTPRQGIFFWVMSSIKTVDDHCGYALPWDPLQHITSNNAAYHDIHHQSWGIKTNFAQPFFTFWDRLLGTMWHGDTSLKYERSRVKAQEFVDAETKKASAKAQ
ncbi:fatty acid hydroxylase superfamily-domain-containing protein [Durotheca rogersii]|uniref:fatty acid hydroxylase superfamily-domain-containing protein n=1 Tax=Durotheca rogersii TaxID=419775 RepID=UPI00221F33DB|nr:fatty acid hydroxylase superfamily-domain-containing protein [Durotheca rogersii]KAI5863087.1 fatty acid hydroxylase superfamily-domain-containing protein [Durotheca rogersii]